MAGKRPDRNDKKPQKEFDEVLLEVRRVTRVTTGGRQLSFRAIVLVGNRKGKI
jgi:small subunit ribosomal protein S5